MTPASIQCLSFALCGIQCFAPHGICIKLCLLMSTLEAIDDLLPFDDSGRPVGISSGLKAVAWPALIEKAVCCHHAHMT